MYYISDYREGNKFLGVYLCKQKQVMKTKAGKTYYSLILQDKTGTVDAKIWELTNAIASFEVMDYIYCEGLVTSFQNKPQININRIRIADEGEYDPTDYIPVTKKDRKEMLKELQGFIESVQNKFLRTILEKYYINDKKFIKDFCDHSAAKSVHHSFMGGLLEHTLSVTKLCQFYSEQYPRLHRDLLITAAIFHDIGKVYEISDFPMNDYTDAGQMLGHIYIGARIVENACDEVEDFPLSLKNELIHCILAHHGQLDYGSPKTPAIIEAMALHMADNTDAKLETMTELFDAAGDDMGWLGFNRFLDSNIRQTSKQ